MTENGTRKKIYCVVDNNYDHSIGATYDLKEAKNYLKEFPNEKLRIEKREIIMQTCNYERLFFERTGVFA